MIPISNELKDAVINEVMPKNVVLDLGFRDIEGFNWYKEEYTPHPQYSTTISQGADTSLSAFSMLRPADNKVDYSKLSEKAYASFSFYLRVNSVTQGDKFAIRMSYKRDYGGSAYYIVDTPTYDVSDFTDFRKITIQLQRVTSYPLLYFYETWLLNKSSGNLEMNFEICNPQVSFYDESGETPDYDDLIFATPANVEEYFNPNYAPIDNKNIISQSFIFKESICSADNLKFGLCEASEIQIDVFDKNYDFVGKKMDLSLQFADIQEKFEWKNYVIAEAKKAYSGNALKRHIVAYDALTNLNENAYSWYTQYMWGINMDKWLDFTPYNYLFDFGRTIFSSVYSLSKAFGLDGVCDHTESLIDSKLYYETNNDMSFNYKTPTHSSYGTVCYAYFEITPSSDYQAYKAILVDFDNIPADYVDYDELYRGLTNACVCVEFMLSGGGEYMGLFDLDEPFILPPNCNLMKVHVPINFANSDGAYGTKLALRAEVYGVNFTNYNPNDIVNAYELLPYYSFRYRKPTLDDIFKADSSITARDVMRSLMEMCGCFFRLDRSGKPQFLYAMEHGLYPSNTLFPADDLFPKKSSEMTMPTSYYIKADFEEYRVSNFGGVQVVVNDFNNNGTVCRWEYWGDNSSDNAYLIDDNIFLCSSQFEYEPQMAGNIETLLENLWGVLNNMSYTPFTAEAIGTPFLESGDRFTLLTKSDGFESFIFERTLKGIQALKDTYEARGKNTPRVKTFEWNN